ncbi:hypothetical protein ACFL20_10515 [Spirochaetota bacterium]
MKKYLILFPLLVLSFTVFLGNVPATYWACDGKKAGDKCAWGMGVLITVSVLNLKSVQIIPGRRLMNAFNAIEVNWS